MIMLTVIGLAVSAVLFSIALYGLVQAERDSRKLVNGTLAK